MLIEERQPQIDALLEHYFPKKGAIIPLHPPVQSDSSIDHELDANALTQQAVTTLTRWKAGRLIGLLDEAEKYTDYKSTSERDFHICCLLTEGGLSETEAKHVWTQSSSGERHKVQNRPGYIALTMSNARAHVGGQGSFRTSSTPMLGGKEETPSVKIMLSTDIPMPAMGSSGGILDPIVPDAASSVLLAGESSAGKTVLGYNMAYHMAEGIEFVGSTPVGPQRVLYFDLESPVGVHRSLVDIVGRSDNLAFVRSLPRTLNTSEGRADFLDACHEFKPDVIFLDPLPVAWPVKDENDNAEADAQMWAIKQMAVELNCVVISMWNMGEGNVKDKFRARGATARIDRCDLALNYTEITDTTRKLKIVKSRYGTLGMGVTLRFAGEMGFEVVESNDGPTPNALSHIVHQIKERANTGQITRQAMIASIGQEDLVDKALHKLIQGGALTRVTRGVYTKGVSSFPPNLGGKDSEETSGLVRAQVRRWTL